MKCVVVIAYEGFESVGTPVKVFVGDRAGERAEAFVREQPKMLPNRRERYSYDIHDDVDCE